MSKGLFILQSVIPADNWFAAYTESDKISPDSEVSFIERLACWGLGRYENETDPAMVFFVGFTDPPKDDLVMPCEESSNFIRYVHHDEAVHRGWYPDKMPWKIHEKEMQAKAPGRTP